MLKMLMKWYSDMDEETLTLMKRFIAKCYADAQPMEYLKKVLRRELDNTVDAPPA